jgi:hypothetical protein
LSQSAARDDADGVGGLLTDRRAIKSTEFSLREKWLGRLKEVAPSMTRVAIIRSPSVPAG